MDYGIDMDGILGMDFLLRVGAVIDLTTLTIDGQQLTLPPPAGRPGERAVELTRNDGRWAIGGESADGPTKSPGRQGPIGIPLPAPVPPQVKQVVDFLLGA